MKYIINLVFAILLLNLTITSQTVIDKTDSLKSQREKKLNSYWYYGWQSNKYYLGWENNDTALIAAAFDSVFKQSDFEKQQRMFSLLGSATGYIWHTVEGIDQPDIKKEYEKLTFKQKENLKYNIIQGYIAYRKSRIFMKKDIKVDMLKYYSFQVDRKMKDYEVNRMINFLNDFSDCFPSIWKREDW